MIEYLCTSLWLIIGAGAFLYLENKENTDTRAQYITWLCVLTFLGLFSWGLVLMNSDWWNEEL